jgi:hypothetical protein
MLSVRTILGLFHCLFSEDAMCVVHLYAVRSVWVMRSITSGGKMRGISACPQIEWEELQLVKWVTESA